MTRQQMSSGKRCTAAGEGHYLGSLLQRLHGDGVAANGYGVDVSKLAVRLAAARHKGAAFAVASIYRLPFDDQVHPMWYNKVLRPML